MMNLYGSPGMGAAGTGMGAGPMVPGGGMDPRLMALLAQMQGQGGAGAPGGVPPPPGPMQAPPTGTPMSNYIGGGMGGGGMGHAMAPPMQQMGQSPQSMPPGATGANGQPGQAMIPGGINPQMLQMLQMLKGQQTGVTPGGGAAAGGAATPPQQMAPGMGGGTGPMAPGVDAWLRSLGMYGGATGGAPT